MRRISAHIAAYVVGIVGMLTAPAGAVSTSHWTQANEADFKAGTTHNVVITNLGDVKLSRAVQTIQQQDPKVTTVNALAQGPDGVIYAGTGPKGVLLAVKDDKVTTVATLDGAVNILSLLVDDHGALLIGTGGEKGVIYKIDKPGDKPHQIFTEEDVQYIWAMVATADGNVYAATGPNGQLFEIKPNGSHSELYKNDENNFTSMVGDGKDLLYIGSDPNGLVIRVDRKTKESFILYNAGESEITALALDGKGNLYAATGEAGERQQQQQPGEAKEHAGRPENNAEGEPIPGAPPSVAPKPPALPNPNPGEPKPIPKGQTRLIVPGINPVMMDVAGKAKDSEKDDDPGDDPMPNAPNGPIQGNGPDMPNPGRHNAAPGPDNNSNEPRPEGNAIYKIDKDGFVTEIFRQNAVIYSMIDQDGSLLVGTGGEGNVYEVNPAEEETVVLAKVDAKEVMALLSAKDGRIFMGLANSGGISAMTSGYASDGTYTSSVLDATQVSRFGKIQFHGLLPDKTGLKVSTRSGNVKDADAQGWSKWSAEVDAAEFITITSPSARFLQYRLSYSTTDAVKTAVIDHVDVTYQVPNLAPIIKSVKIGNAGGDAGANGPPQAGPQQRGGDQAVKPQGTGSQTITWEASDPNNDTLTFSLYFRTENHGQWILLKEKIKDQTFDWDTRAAANGRYQIKVVASDAASNPIGTGKTTSRVSDYFVVDNSPPTIGDLTSKTAGNSATINFRVQDSTSIVAGVDYTVDSSDDWQAVLPVDNIFDSLDETVNFTIPNLTPGPHQVTIRATDSHGNQALQTVVVKIEGVSARKD